jgi:hypothetical protein
MIYTLTISIVLIGQAIVIGYLVIDYYKEQKQVHLGDHRALCTTCNEFYSKTNKYKILNETEYLLKSPANVKRLKESINSINYIMNGGK